LFFITKKLKNTGYFACSYHAKIRLRFVRNNIKLIHLSKLFFYINVIVISKNFRKFITHFKYTVSLKN
jgi:hypothetical protein